MCWVFWDATIFCNNFAQTCATPSQFWQTRLFTNSSNISTTIRGSQFYAPQTKILDGRTNVWERIFEVLFKGWVLDLGYVPLKSASKMRSQMFVRTSKTPIFTNPPFHEFLKHFNHDLWFTIFGNSWKGGFVKIGEEWHTTGLGSINFREFVKRQVCQNWGGVAHLCFARWLQKMLATCDVFSRMPLIPLFFDNLHFEHFVKSVNLKSRLNYLTKSSKWRLSKKRGWVAYGWMCWVFWDATIFCNNFARWLQR